MLVYQGGGREGNCLFKHDGIYYFCSSDLHGWNASAQLLRLRDQHPWSIRTEFVMGGTERDFSHVTQTGFFISVKGSVQNTIIFAGDRWSDFAGNGLGYNQWMPLTFSGPHAADGIAQPLVDQSGDRRPGPSTRVTIMSSTRRSKPIASR